jgi:transcriptional regulator with XRE-family HTH domain
MILSQRLRTLRESKRLSRIDIELSTGLSLALIENIENGHSVPNLEILKKWARALSVPLQQLFCEGKDVPPLQNLPGRLTADQIAEGRINGKTSSRRRAGSGVGSTW